MNKLKTIVLDDEPLALNLVKNYVLKTPFLNLQAAFDNPIEAVEYIAENSIDLVILDIQMPDLSGTDFIRSLQGAPKFIFTTAFEKYALEGFRLNAADYLLKPFNYQEFLVAVQKVRKLVELESSALPVLDVNNEFLFLKSEYKIRRINFQEIIYIEGLKDYVKVYLQKEEKPILSINTLKSLEHKLPAERFMRVHRSFIVNLGKIETIERSRIVFGKVYIPVSEQYREKFQNFVNQNFL